MSTTPAPRTPSAAVHHPRTVERRVTGHPTSDGAGV